MLVHQLGGPPECGLLRRGAYFVQKKRGSHEGPLNRGIIWQGRYVRRLCNSKMIWRQARESFQKSPILRRLLQ